MLLALPSEERREFMPGGASIERLAAYVMNKNLKGLTPEEQGRFFAGEGAQVESVLHGVPPELRSTLFVEEEISPLSIFRFVLQTSPLSAPLQVIDALTAAARAYSLAYQEYIGTVAGREQFQRRYELKEFFANLQKSGIFASLFRRTPYHQLKSAGKADLGTRVEKWEHKKCKKQLVPNLTAPSNMDFLPELVTQYVVAFDAPEHREVLERTNLGERLVVFQSEARKAFSRGDTFEELRGVLGLHGVTDERTLGRLKNVAVHHSNPSYPWQLGG